MKVQHLAPGLWDVAVGPDYEPSSLSLAASASGFKRLCPLATGLSSSSSSSPDSAASTVSAAFDLKSFIRPESTARKLGSSSPDSGVKGDSRPPMETHPGVTRWNPTIEQVGILEALYRAGMRTPSAQQIEQITAQLRKFGKIEGKNVFYWFQNHKARERQKQKRHNLGLVRCPSTPTSPTTVINSITPSTTVSREEAEMITDEDDSPYKKRSCRGWAFELLQGDQIELSCRANRGCGEDRTLELFPLHPEP